MRGVLQCSPSHKRIAYHIMALVSQQLADLRASSAAAEQFSGKAVLEGGPPMRVAVDAGAIESDLGDHG
jgi:hypothetical protein